MTIQIYNVDCLEYSDFSKTTISINNSIKSLIKVNEKLYKYNINCQNLYKIYNLLSRIKCSTLKIHIKDCNYNKTQVFYYFVNICEELKIKNLICVM